MKQFYLLVLIMQFLFLGIKATEITIDPNPLYFSEDYAGTEASKTFKFKNNDNFSYKISMEDIQKQYGSSWITSISIPKDSLLGKSTIEITVKVKYPDEGLVGYNPPSFLFIDKKNRQTYLVGPFIQIVSKGFAAPANPKCNNVTPSGCLLSWDKPLGTIDGYKIYQDEKLIQTVTSGNSISITGLMPATTYGFSIAAFHGTAISSNKAYITVQTCPLAPSIPVNLGVTNITNSGCVLSWAASTGGVSGYKIYQDGTLVQTVSGTSATISSLSSGSSYMFRVSAYNCGGESSQSTGLTVLTVPSAPCAANASEITTIGCNLSWTAPSGTVTGYKVYQNNSLVQTTTMTSVNIENLNINTTYDFAISAYNSSGESTQKNWVTIKTKALAGPTNLTVSNITNTGCTLLWNGQSYRATGYKIYQYLPTSAVYTTGSNMSYTFSNLTPNTEYKFAVSAYDDEGESNISNTVDFISYSKSAPSINLTASNITSSGCTLSWTAPSGTVSGYYIYQDGVRIQTTTSVGATIGNLSSGATYTFTVSAYDNSVELGKSNSVEVSTLSLSLAPSAPTNLILSNITSTGCTLSWTASTGIVTGYYIYLSAGNTLIAKMPTTSTTYAFTGGSGSNFNFYVTAYNSVAESSKSNVVYKTLSSSSVSLKSAKISSATSQDVKTTLSADMNNGSLLTVTGNVLLYPNPLSDRLFVEGVADFDIKIYDLNGKEVLNKTKQNGSIDTSGLSQGAYIVQIKSGDISVSKKIMKQ